MKNTALTFLCLLLLPMMVDAKIDGIVEFKIGEDSTLANEISVVGGGGGMINIYRYTAWADADRMPKPFFKDTIKHVWSYRAVDESDMRWILIDEASGASFSAMKDVWLKFKDYASWWINKEGITTNEKIRVSPEKKSALLNDSTKCPTYKVLEVQGDWMRVQYNCADTETSGSGWILWRRKSELLVGFK